MGTVVIITGAVPSARALTGHMPSDAVVIAADSGLDHALAAGIQPTIVVGDLDSVTPDGAAWARAHADLQEHPGDKGSTDTELALDVANGLAPDRVLLIGGPDGTRLDHSLGALGALGRGALGGVNLVEAWWGTTYVRLLHGPDRAALDLVAGALFSVLAMHGPASGVTVAGARWPLDAVELPPLSGWGISNEATAPPVTVEVIGGVITVIVPGGAPS
ncbi:MAG: thiamine diphosphokinase [Actinomycetota bacterium]|nr:thiamine diphosphokinase [Actinomycetota bacterium]